MKTKSTILLMVMFCCIFVAYRDVTGFSNGAPDGNTGSPGDGQTCTTCHSGAPVVSIPNLISSNIPASGYLGDSIYTLTAKIVWPGHSTFGFQVSPQSPTGLFLGELIQTDPTTEVTGFGRYVNHVLAGTSGTDSLSWTFDWQAPPPGTGDVTFYGAFNVANGDGFNSFDTIVNSSLLITEDLTVGLRNTSGIERISIYPNPVSERCIITTLNPDESLPVSIYDAKGQLVYRAMLQSGSTSQINLDLAVLKEAGLYHVEVQSGSSKSVLPFVFAPAPR